MKILCGMTIFMIQFENMKNLLILVLAVATLYCCNETPKADSKPTSMIPENFDWQGHRGCRGILPENSMPAFLKALEYPVKTLELDIVVSGDGQLVISHEPWFNHAICTMPNGDAIPEADAMKLSLYNMSYDEIREFDCGSIGNERFPEQVKMQVQKPRLLDMIGTVDNYAEDNKRPKPHYNIEIKSDPRGYDVMFPQPEAFVKLVLSELAKVNIKGRTTVQSFDVNVIEELNKQNSPYKTAYLVEGQKEGLQANLDKLTFKPEIYSPYFKVLNQGVVDSLHDMNIQVIPWTVNEVQDMRDMIKMGVDGIITDYPNRIAEVDEDNGE